MQHNITMKKSVLLILALLMQLSVVLAQGLRTVMSFNLTDVTFARFTEEVQKGSGVKIWTHAEWTDTLRVSINDDNIEVIDAVRQVLKGTSLTACVWNSDIVIIPGEGLPAILPSYEQEYIIDTSAKKAKKLTATEERYITGRKPGVIQTLRIGRSGGSMKGSKARIIGRVLDNNNGEPLINATMYIAEIRTGAVTDLNGYFTIMLKPGKYNAVFEILGYEKTRYLIDVLSDGEIKVALNSAVIEMKEFVVYGDRQMNIKAKDPGLDKISMKSVRELPMLMGERDILKVSSMLPGIVSTGEGASGLNVRGGGSDQNAFYINKIPIYNTSHLFGFFPAFNSDIIKDFSIYKGHIPAQYGGRLSSVFNIVTRQGNRKRFTAHGGLSPITGNIVVEGPIKKDTSSILLSLRSSYSDWLLKRIEDPSIRASSANFNDVAASVNYDLNKTQMSVFVYHSDDRFRLADITEYAYSNNGTSFNLIQIFSNRLRGEFSLIGSQYDFKTTDTQDESSAYKHAYKMGHYEARADFKHMISDVHTLDYGADFIIYKLDKGQVNPYGESSIRILVDHGKEQGVEGALYLSDSYDVLPWMNLTAGMRYALFMPIGKQTVYNYFDGLPLDARYTSDTLEFGNNEIIKRYSQPDVRVAVNIETDVNGSIKLAFNQMHQNLFMLNNTITVAPNTQWKLADYHLEPSRSEQFSAGVFRILGQTGLEASIEGYYKRSSNYPEFKDGANFLENPRAETNVLQGEQNALGLEFFLKRSSRKLEGWISYTYSRTTTKVDGANPWDKVNNGELFPSNFDIPNAVNAVLNYHFTRRITMSSVIAYQTGKPITYPVSIYYINGVPYLDYSKRNAYRIPDYFRTDLSLTIEGNLKKNKLLHSSFIFSVYNLTGRANPYSVYFRTDNGRIRSFRYSVIGVPILTATWIFKLGNYASD